MCPHVAPPADLRIGAIRPFLDLLLTALRTSGFIGLWLLTRRGLQAVGVAEGPGAAAA